MQQFGAALLVGMVHDDDHAFDTGDQIHRPAHTLDQLTGHHPVGEVARLAHLHRAQNGEIDVAATDHRKRIRAGEKRCARQRGDGLLAGIDQIGIDRIGARKRPHAEHAVFRLQGHVHAIGDVVRHQRRNADAEIDIETIAQFLSCAPGHLFACPGHLNPPAACVSQFSSRTCRLAGCAVRRCPACGYDRGRCCRSAPVLPLRPP